MKQNEVVVVEAFRTAVGDYGGALREHSPVELAGMLVRRLVDTSNLAPAFVGHAVFGNVFHSASADMYLARAAALAGGLPVEVPGLTVNRLCGSGLQAIITAAQQIQLGLCDTAIAGGAESMTRTPYWLPGMRFGQRMGNSETVDPVVSTLHCPFSQLHMGETAERVARRFDVSREAQDELALLSHQRAQRAIEQGLFAEQIVPVALKGRQAGAMFDRDEHVRFDCQLADLQKLRPVFETEGSVTAGNASGLNDAAAALLLMSRDRAMAEGRRVLGRLLDYEVVGVAPDIMGIGPVPAISKLLDRNKLEVSDIDLFEVNEAFAAQALAVAKMLKLPAERLNPNGSGISIGHPIGATGALITVKALHELQRIQGNFAVVSLCIGGGQGIAVLFTHE